MSESSADTSLLSDNEPPRRWHGREPSKGCEACRRRKIKCDEKHPVCSRCHAHRLGCEYRDYSLLMFRDETISTASKVRRRVQTKQLERGDIIVAPKITNPGPSMQVLPSIRQTAINRFFHDFVLKGDSLVRQTSNPHGGYFALVPDLFYHCDPHSCFALALSAVANANLWTRHKSFQARSNSLVDYSKALQQLRNDLQSKNRSQVTTATTMLTSSLLATYELIVSGDLSQRRSWCAHIQGAVALLATKSDGEDQSGHKEGGISIIVVFQMLVDCLIMAKHPSLPIEACTSVASRHPGSLLGFMYRTAQLCATWKDAVNSSVGRVDYNNLQQQDFDISQFLVTCNSLDVEIEHWMQEEPQEEVGNVTILQNTEQNVPIPLRSLFAAAGAPKTLRLCADFNQTQRWHFYRACRLTLLRTMMTAINTTLSLSTPTDAPLTDYYKQIQALIHSRATRLVDDLLSTSFSTLRVNIAGKGEPKTVADIQGFRGWQLLWPLHSAGTCLISMAGHCPNGSEKLEWVRTVFRYIRDDLGIQSANNFLQNNPDRITPAPEIL